MTVSEVNLGSEVEWEEPWKPYHKAPVLAPARSPAGCGTWAPQDKFRRQVSPRRPLARDVLGGEAGRGAPGECQ